MDPAWARCPNAAPLQACAIPWLGVPATPEGPVWAPPFTGLELVTISIFPSSSPARRKGSRSGQGNRSWSRGCFRGATASAALFYSYLFLCIRLLVLSGTCKRRSCLRISISGPLPLTLTPFLDFSVGHSWAVSTSYARTPMLCFNNTQASHGKRVAREPHIA